MTPTRAELMETAEINDSLRDGSPPFNGVLDTVEGHLRQLQKVLWKSVCKLQEVLLESVYSRLQEVLQDDNCSQL